MSSTHNNINPPKYQAIGDIDEKGAIHDLTRCGYNDYNSYSELFANSIDAGAKNITTVIDTDTISIIDNGKGMNYNNIVSLLSLYKSNHENDESMGVSGKGFKGASIKLSDKRNVNVLTSDGNTFIKLTIDWSKIFKEGKYTGMTVPEDMSQEEIELFLLERKDMNNVTGTTIKFPNNDSNSKLLRDNFDPEKKKKLIRNDRFDVQFGKFNITFKLIDNSYSNVKPYHLNMYDLLSSNEDRYYINESFDISLYYDEKKQKYYFIVCGFEIKSKKSKKYIIQNEEKMFYIKTDNRGCSNEPSNFLQSELPKSWEYVGRYTFTNAMMKNKRVFDINNPKLTQYSKKNKDEDKDEIGREISDYITDYFNSDSNWDNIKSDMSKCALYRSGQLIGTKPIEGFSSNNARADNKSLIKIVFLQSELSWTTKSTQNNHLDLNIGVQSTKTQLSNDGFKPEFMRLLKFLKNSTFDKLYSEFSAKDKQALEVKRELEVKQAKINAMKEELKQKEDINKQLLKKEQENAVKEKERLKEKTQQTTDEEKYEETKQEPVPKQEPAPKQEPSPTQEPAPKQEPGPNQDPLKEKGSEKENDNCEEKNKFYKNALTQISLSVNDTQKLKMIFEYAESVINE